MAQSSFSASSLRFSSATLTASTTNAVKVHCFPSIACSTSSIISLGNLMHLFVVGGMAGILNFFTLINSAIQIYIHCIVN